jgi:hypothetical protein
VIPGNVRFIDGFAFIGVALSSISIESGKDIFVIENSFLIDAVHHKFIRNVSESSEFEIAKLPSLIATQSTPPKSLPTNSYLIQAPLPNETDINV